MEGSEWSSLRFSRFVPRENYPGTQYVASFTATNNFPFSYTVSKDTHISFPETSIQGVYKLSEDFAKSYFRKYWTEIHDVATI
jgi:hypothetical protein